MKYGESSFAILYLLFAIVSGCVILKALTEGTAAERRNGDGKRG